MSRLDNTERRATIASGEMYPECGMLESQRETRWLADKSSFGNPGNGTPDNEKYRRLAADPPKNESGMAVSVSSCDVSRISVNSGNDTCIGAKTSANCGPTRSERRTSHMRPLCPSAAMTLSVPDDEDIFPETRRDKAGQTSSLSFAGVWGVQESRRFRRRGDSRTRLLHLRHT